MFADELKTALSALVLTLGSFGIANAQSIIAHDFPVIAQLTPTQKSTLSAELATRITDLPLKEGQPFQTGDLLVGLDCAISKSKLESANADAEKALKNLEIVNRLLKFNSKTTTEVDIAKADLMKAKANVAAEQAYTSKCTILAPFHGKVSEVRVDNHEFVRVGDPLIRIIDDTVLGVEFLAPSHWVTRLDVGAVFDVDIVETGKRYGAKVTARGAAIDPVSHSFKVIGQLSLREPELMAGMTGKVILPEMAQQ